MISNIPEDENPSGEIPAEEIDTASLPVFTDTHDAGLSGPVKTV
jgi:hypothetical protein